MNPLQTSTDVKKEVRDCKNTIGKRVGDEWTACCDTASKD